MKFKVGDNVKCNVNYEDCGLNRFPLKGEIYTISGYITDSETSFPRLKEFSGSESYWDDSSFNLVKEIQETPTNVIKVKVSEMKCTYPNTSDDAYYTVKRKTYNGKNVDYHTLSLHHSKKNGYESSVKGPYASVEDDGNGYNVNLNDGTNFSLDYCKAEELLILLGLQNELNSKTEFTWIRK